MVAKKKKRKKRDDSERDSVSIEMMKEKIRQQQEALQKIIENINMNN